MFEWRGIWLPDGEEHLVEWMTQVGHTRAGLPTYQYHKYEDVLRLVPFDRRRVAVDVGAHVGLWSRVMALDFDRVECFEPVPAHRDCWERNLAATENVVMHPCALGPERAKVTMHTGPDSSGDTWVDPRESGGDVIQVPLDSFEFPIVDFLKIDCEGYESHVLEGAEETLLRCKPVICVEQKQGHGEKYGLADTQALLLLESLGFRRRGGIQGDFFLTWGG